MCNWKEITGIDLGELINTRKALHMAVQIVASAPRNILAHDPTDTNASLVWNNDLKGLESIPMLDKNGNQVCLGLMLKDFSLYIVVEGDQKTSFDLEGKSVNEGLEWAKIQLEGFGLVSTEMDLNLPYEIENYDYTQPLFANEQALQEYAYLYSNSEVALEQVVGKNRDAFDIRCWPHHFDLATLLPLEMDNNGEITKSIGVGLSPGDESVHEPYAYVNVWPNVSYEKLIKHELQAGHWNQNGWSGAVLSYTELLATEDQQSSYQNFVEDVIQTLLKAAM